jgi:hypothetical protein
VTVHLIKMAVGVESAKHLSELQAERIAQAKREGRKGLRHMTRHMPKRSEDLLDGGSLYWVIKGVIRVRQRLVGLVHVDTEGRRRCALMLDRKLVRVEPRSRGAFQGWRYLEVADAPPDVIGAAAKAEEMPGKMAAELRDLGLL